MILTPDHRVRVFISSTLKELEDERKAAAEAVESLRLRPILFEAGARPHPPRDIYRAYLSQSHIFIGIYWKSYGWVAPDMDVSGLEDEYSLSGGMPRLIYMKSPSDGRDERLKQMIDRMKADGISYKHFSDAKELGDLIRDDLAVLLSERFELKKHKYIPVPTCTMIGSDSHLKSALDYIDSGIRIITITGPPGVGKTRLAIEIALRSSLDICWVPLESAEDEKDVISCIARSLDLKDGSGLEAIKEHMRDEEILLILDGFEHVLEASGAISDLMAYALKARCIITSRTPLHIYGEHEISLVPLSEGQSVELFTEIAKAVYPGFSLDSSNIEDVKELVRRLDFLPLAIELAASRMKAFTPEEILGRLDIDILMNRQRDAPKRHESMRSAIGWSFGLLDPKARSLLHTLSSIPDPFTLDEAEEASGGDDIFDTIQTLVDNSLLMKSGGRFQMLNIVREYARDAKHSDQAPA